MAEQEDRHSDQSSYQLTRQTDHPVIKTDEELFPQDKYENVTVNNQYVVFDNLKFLHKALVAVLKHHPINYALTAHTTVPMVYLQQAWHTIKLVQSEHGTIFTFNIDDVEVSVNLTFFRDLLNLPRRNHYEGHDMFQDPADSGVLTRDFITMGYSDESFSQPSMFRRNKLPGMWYILFGVLAKALCPSGSGLDKGTKNFLQLFHAFCFHRRVDYAVLIWNELREAVLSKESRKPRTFIPYTRFLSLIISYTMQQDVTIARREDHLFASSPIKFQVQRRLKKGERQMPIPVALLRVAHLDADVIEYVREKYQYHQADDEADDEEERGDDGGEGERQQGDDRIVPDSDHGDDYDDQPPPSKRRKVVRKEKVVRVTQPRQTVVVTQPHPRQIVVTHPERPQQTVVTQPERPTHIAVTHPAQPKQVSVIAQKPKKRITPEKIKSTIIFDTSDREEFINLDEYYDEEKYDEEEEYHQDDTWEYDHDQERQASSPQVTLSLTDVENIISKIISSAEIPITSAATTGPSVKSISRNIQADIPITSPILTESTSVTVTKAPPTTVQITTVIPPIVTTVVPTVVTTSPIPPHIPLSNQFDARSMDLDDLKNLLLTRLISQVTPDKALTESDQSLLDFLKAHSRQQHLFDKEDIEERLRAVETSQFGILKNQSMMMEQQRKFEESIKESMTETQSAVAESLHLIMERLAMVEETCRSSLTSTSRRDEQDPDAAEGENRNQAGPTASVVETTTVKATTSETTHREPTAKEKQQYLKELYKTKVVGNVAHASSLLSQKIQKNIDVAMGEGASTERFVQQKVVKEVVQTTVAQSLMKDVMVDHEKRMKEQAEKEQREREQKEREDKEIADLFKSLEEEQTLSEPLDEFWTLKFHEEEVKRAKAEEEQKRKAKEAEQAKAVQMKGFRPWDIAMNPPKADPKTFKKSTIKDLIIEACMKTGRTRYNAAYLEDSFVNLFTDKTTKPNMYRLYMVSDWSQLRKNRFKAAMNTAKRTRDEVLSRHKISRITKISKTAYHSHAMSEFKVVRVDGKEYEFSEADFANLNLRDIDWIYNELRSWKEKVGAVQDAERAIRRYMNYLINLRCSHDFQMALECGQTIVNLTRPSQVAARIELGGLNYEVSLQRGMLGIFYPDEQGQRKFLIKNEVHKYSDGTLKIINTNLRGQIVVTDYLQADLDRDQSIIYQQKLIRELHQAIQLTLNEREYIRCFEEYFGLRQKRRTLDD